MNPDVVEGQCAKNAIDRITGNNSPVKVRTIIDTVLEIEDAGYKREIIRGWRGKLLRDFINLGLKKGTYAIFSYDNAPENIKEVRGHVATLIAGQQQGFNGWWDSPISVVFKFTKNTNESYLHIGQGGRRYWGDKGAGILFTDGTRILLLRRAQEGAADEGETWGIPGGKAEKGESAIETAIRETKEEAGNVEGTRFAQFDERDGRHIFTVFLYKVREPFDVRISKEHTDSKWINLTDLGGYRLHPKFESHLPYYLKAIHKKFTAKTLGR